MCFFLAVVTLTRNHDDALFYNGKIFRMDLVRAITLQTLRHNVTFTATHIPGLDNSFTDSLSRFQMDRIAQNGATHLGPKRGPYLVSKREICKGLSDKSLQIQRKWGELFKHSIHFSLVLKTKRF